jgi:hypothetical protein
MIRGLQEKVHRLKEKEELFSDALRRLISI